LRDRSPGQQLRFGEFVTSDLDLLFVRQRQAVGIF